MQKGSRFSKDGGMNESSPITILIVEYANRTALVMKEKLETCGYKVIIADSIEKAIDAINGLVAIHLFLLDIALISKMDETGLVRQISAYDSPLVFLTSHSESNIIEKTEGFSQSKKEKKAYNKITLCWLNALKKFLKTQ